MTTLNARLRSGMLCLACVALATHIDLNLGSASHARRQPDMRSLDIVENGRLDFG